MNLWKLSDLKGESISSVNSSSFRTSNCVYLHKNLQNMLLRRASIIKHSQYIHF